MAFENFPIQFPSDFLTCHYNSGIFTNVPSSPNFLPSTSDEAEDRQVEAVDERKRRRMISNRESARRSRMRKQRQIDELWSQVMKLRSENKELFNKLKEASACHDRVLQENAQLKQGSAGLRQMIEDLQIDGPYSVLKALEEVSCNSAHLKAQGPNQLAGSTCICKLQF